MADGRGRTPQGLVTNHAYSITKVCYVPKTTPSGTNVISLIRVRNPWGDDVEWNGPWSDQLVYNIRRVVLYVIN